ncbi:hypothetical protein CRUP_023100, partial [Coryphaenoides rupestris]
AVEACVLHGLKRRAAGFLRSNKVAALFTKRRQEHMRTQSLQSQDSLRRLTRLPSLAPHSVKNLWIRTALFEKVLDRIVVYLVENSSKFYEKEAVLMDPWPPWMRCLWTSSSADGSVQKWSAVFILVYSSAQGPTDTHRTQDNNNNNNNVGRQSVEELASC